jgi:hypothetical protein
MRTVDAEKTAQLYEMLTPSSSTMSPSLHARRVCRQNTREPMSMPWLADPLASSTHPSSMATSSPIRIFPGCRSTTFVPKLTFRPHAPRTHG